MTTKTRRRRPITISKKGALRKFGYSTSDSPTKRRRSLRKAAKKYGAVDVVKRLNAICILTKNTAPTRSKKFCSDKRWVQRNLYKGGKPPSYWSSRSRSRTKRRKPKTKGRTRKPRRL
jgi:hypothetical protein